MPDLHSQTAANMKTHRYTHTHTHTHTHTKIYIHTCTPGLHSQLANSCQHEDTQVHTHTHTHTHTHKDIHTHMYARFALATGKQLLR